MSQTLPIAIRGTGSAVPARVMTNADFAAYLDTSDEWIVGRTGIRERHVLSDGEGTVSLAEQASRQALEQAGIEAGDLDLIVVCTFTPDTPLPSAACVLQASLGAKGVPAFDLAAACSGFVYGLVTAGGMIGSGLYERALVVGADSVSRVTDYQDRRSCVLFGDAAGAVVLERSRDPEQGILFSRLGADGQYARLMWIPGGGSMLPSSEKTVGERLHFMRMQGREVYKFAVLKLQEVIEEAMESAGISWDDLTLVIPHQSNLRIIEAAREKLGIPAEKTYVNIDRFGNTSAASIPVCLDEACRRGLLKRSDLVLLASIGAGFTWASALLRM